MPAATASQTIGPYWHLLEDPAWSDLTRFGATGERIALIGTLSDGDGLPVGDACVELWQPSPPASDVWHGFGRAATDPEGNWRFVTLRPGAADASQAPHAALAVFARGLLTHLHTRVYFDGDPRNEADPLLASSTLAAAPRCSPARSASATACPPGGSTSACRARTRRCSWTSERRRPTVTVGVSAFARENEDGSKAAGAPREDGASAAAAARRAA